MSWREQLNLYIGQVQRRLRLDVAVRGAAVVASVALVATVLLILILNAYAFPEHGLTPARLVLLAAVAAAAGFGLALPWLRLDRRRSIHQAEAAFPELDQRLVTFSEREQAADPFIELLAADTLAVVGDAPPARLAPRGRLLALIGIGVACAGILVWMVFAGPGYLGYGASLLWTGPKPNAAPLYEIRVTPGDAAVRRNSDQLVTAEVVGLETNEVNLYARYQSASNWEPVAMQAQEGRHGFQFLFAGLPESVEYYVAAGPVSSKHFNFRVVDLPAVKQIQVIYHYPKWTGLQPVSEEQGGDLRALEGTDAELTVVMDAPLKDGVLMMDNGQALHLTRGEGNWYRGTIHMDKDGAYHVAAMDQGQQVRLSEDYFISTSKANPPEITIDRPAQDYRASPIEEVTVEVKAGTEFGLNQMSLHYSVNGGREQTVNLLKEPGAKSSKGATTLNLENFKLVPGDVVSLYATANDAHAESRTDITFIQADPFEREFSQSQQSGGGGSGAGQKQGNQTDISRREKELIAATWKQQNDNASTPQQAADMGKVLSEAQAKLREQALALSGRMQSRDLAEANEEFNNFEKDMQAAAAAMMPSAEKLKQLAWSEAMSNEQKALQALLRAEATFRQIQVAFGQRSGGGGGGAGRDLASLFDLELDTEKNQYETAQTGSPAEEQAKKVDEALEKLDALAKRQEELAQQQQNQAQTFQQRWQQEMLRREAEQLQREMEQMQGQQGQDGQQSVNGASGQGASGQAKERQSQHGQSESQNGVDLKDKGADPRVQQALNRLRAANEEMRRAGSQAGQQSPDQARRTAKNLREATSLLGGAQKEQASGKLDSLSRESARLTKEESAQADLIRSLGSRQDEDAEPTPAQMAARAQEIHKLTDDRQRLSDDLAHLEKGLRDTARQLAPSQPGTSSKLRDALSEMDQSDLGNRVQRTADWLRRGINPNSNGTESEIASGLKKLNDQVRQAQQGMSAEANGQSKTAQGTETASLDHVERLRSEIQRLSSGRGPEDQQQGQEAQQGQGNQRQGQRGQSGQAGQGSLSGQQGQSGANGRAKGAQSGEQQTGGQQGNGQLRRQIGQKDGESGDIGNGNPQSGGDGVVTYNVNTGNNKFDPTGRHPNAPDHVLAPADSERIIRQGLQELNQLRQSVKNDPAALHEIQDLVNEMQQLDSSRFPGNPAMVEQLHMQVLNDVDKLELQIRRNADPQSGQVRTGKAPTVPEEYQGAVAEYFRQLSKGK